MTDTQNLLEEEEKEQANESSSKPFISEAHRADLTSLKKEYLTATRPQGWDGRTFLKVAALFSIILIVIALLLSFVYPNLADMWYNGDSNTYLTCDSIVHLICSTNHYASYGFLAAMCVVIGGAGAIFMSLIVTSLIGIARDYWRSASHMGQESLSFNNIITPEFVARANELAAGIAEDICNLELSDFIQLAERIPSLRQIKSRESLTDALKAIPIMQLQEIRSATSSQNNQADLTQILQDDAQTNYFLSWLSLQPEPKKITYFKEISKLRLNEVVYNRFMDKIKYYSSGWVQYLHLASYLNNLKSDELLQQLQEDAKHLEGVTPLQCHRIASDIMTDAAKDRDTSTKQQLYAIAKLYLQKASDKASGLDPKTTEYSGVVVLQDILEQDAKNSQPSSTSEAALSTSASNEQKLQSVM